MRARVRKQSGGHQPVRTEEPRREQGTAAADSDVTGGRSAVAEVSKDEGQGGAHPPWPALVAATIPAGVTVVSPMADSTWKRESMVMPADGSLVVLDVAPDQFAPRELAGLAKFHRGGMLIGYDDSPAARDELVELNLFKVAGAPDRLFAATYELGTAEWLEKIEHKKYAVPGELAKSSELPVRLIKAEEVADERLVYGVVLEPDGVDAQNDTISSAEIRAAAHKFMQDYKNVGLQHQTFINGKAHILESYIAPVDFTIDDQPIKKGTWLMSMRVADDDIWAAVKSGAITGFSIGGSAVRKPDAVA